MKCDFDRPVLDLAEMDGKALIVIVESVPKKTNDL